MLAEIVIESSSFAIYGAQTVAYGTYVAIKHLYNRKPECFIVSKLDGNPHIIDSIKVHTLEAVASNTLILIAVTELLQDEIAEALQVKGYRNTVRLTSHEEFLLMWKYYESISRFPLAIKIPQHVCKDFSFYEVRHHLDKPLKKPPKLNSWEFPIQAGAAITEMRICQDTDHSGDNISDKNRLYCEASVMYWCWKNGTSAWVGIEHYRRHLLITPNMLTSNVDAILSLPYVCYPSSEAHFRRFVSKDVADAVTLTLKALYPNEYDRYKECLNGNYHYAYNLIAAKKTVFDDYCRWAFKVTERMEESCMQSVKEPRVLGYVIEMLTSIYFITNYKNLNIKHVEKVIYK